MHIISKKALETFWRKHPTSKAPLLAWHKIVSVSNFVSFAQLKQTFSTADYVAPFIIFDIGGNNFRIITVVHFNRQKLYVREVLTHTDYDRWNKIFRSKKL